MIDSDLLRQKHFLRLHFIALNRDRPVGLRRRDARRAARRLMSRPEWRRAETVGLFLSLPHEIDTAPLIRAGRAAGKIIAVPVVAPETRGMRFARLPKSQGALRKNAHGVWEPRDPEWVERPDLLVVPGAAFTKGGERLGAGGGYFDRYLSETPRLKTLGYCFDHQLAVRLPGAVHDRRVNAVVTPGRVFARR